MSTVINRCLGDMDLMTVRVIKSRYDGDIRPRYDESVFLHVSSHEYPAPPALCLTLQSSFIPGPGDESANVFSKV